MQRILNIEQHQTETDEVKLFGIMKAHREYIDIDFAATDGG